MKLKKVMLMAALAAAIGSVNMVTALADEAETKYGWEGSGNTWRYYEADGSLKNGGWVKAEEGDGRGNEVWYYIDPTSHLMVYNTTRTIDGVSYTFNEDGSWVAPAVTAPKGHVTNNKFYNTWANLCFPQVIGTTEVKEDVAEVFIGSSYAAVGSPYRTQDFCMNTDFGDVEVYYLDMKNKPEMDAPSFAAAFAAIEKEQKGQASEVSTVTIANQQYSKVSVTGKKTTSTYYCRKQGGYMIVIQTTGKTKNAGSLESIVMNMTTAQ